MTTLSDEDRHHLEQAAHWRYAGQDLRFEGGPWVAALDRLAERGLVTCDVGEVGYMVSYTLTEAGRAALAETAQGHRG